MCTLLRVKRGVYKVTIMDFCCCKDADNFKSTVWVVKINNFHITIQYLPVNNNFGLKIVILTPKIVENIFEIISIFMAAINHMSNFLDTPLDPNYCTTTKIVNHRVKNSYFFQCILLKSQIHWGFFHITHTQIFFEYFY